jgi:hypothetical protein
VRRDPNTKEVTRIRYNFDTIAETKMYEQGRVNRGEGTGERG